MKAFIEQIERGHREIRLPLGLVLKETPDVLDICNFKGGYEQLGQFPIARPHSFKEREWVEVTIENGIITKVEKVVNAEFYPQTLGEDCKRGNHEFYEVEGYEGRCCIRCGVKETINPGSKVTEAEWKRGLIAIALAFLFMVASFVIASYQERDRITRIDYQLKRDYDDRPFTPANAFTPANNDEEDAVPLNILFTNATDEEKKE